MDIVRQKKVNQLPVGTEIVANTLYYLNLGNNQFDFYIANEAGNALHQITPQSINYVESIQGGNGVNIDNTDPSNPIINLTISDTTYTFDATDVVGGDVDLLLNGSDGTQESVRLLAGNNISLSSLNNQITIDSSGGVYTAGSGLDIVGSEFSHSDTSTQLSSINTDRTYIQTIELDTFGHVTNITTATETGTGTGTDIYVSGSTFNALTGDLTLTRSDGNTIIENLDGRYLTTETDSQTLAWDGATGQITISNGNTIDIDGRYIQSIPLSYLESGDNISELINDAGYVTNNTFVSGLTYNDSNVITLKQNNGEPDLSVNIGVMSGLTVNGLITATGGTSNQWNQSYNNSITDISLANETISLSKLSGGTFGVDVSPLTKLSKVNTSTGILSGGLLSINATDNTKFDISAGIGYVVDDTVSPSVVTEVNFGPFTNLTVTNLATTFATDIAIDVNGNVIQQSAFTDEELRSVILLGGLDHSSQVNINNVFPLQIPVNAPASSVSELATAVGDVNLAGNSYGPNSTNLLGINKSAGEFFAYGTNNAFNKNKPHIITNPSSSNIEFSYVFDNGSTSAIFTAPTNDVNPNNYDDGTGTLATVPVNKWTVQRILLFPNSNKTFIQYGNKTFGKLSDALNDPTAFQFETLFGLVTASIRGFIVVRQGETDLNSADTMFVGANKFGQVASAAGGASGVSWGEISGTITDQVDLTTELNKTIDTIDVSGTSTKTITLTRLNGSTIQGTFTDKDTIYSAGSGLSLVGTQFSHANTSAQASTTNTGRTYIKNINLDTYGHITSLTTGTETVVNTDDYVTSSVFDIATGNLTLTRLDGGTIVQNLDGRYLTSETDSQTLSFDALTGNLTISNGNIVDLDGRYSLLGHSHVIADITDFPTNVSYFTNDAGYVTTDTNTTYTAGVGLDLVGTEFRHTDTSTQTSSINTDRTYIQTVEVDDYGHVTNITTATETSSGGNDVAIENPTATGTLSLDLSTFSSAKLTLTGNLTLDVINTPPVGESKTVTLVLDSATNVETLTLPASWNLYGDYSVATRNKLTIEFANYPTSGLEVDCFINQPNV